ncbi:Uncharacterised protein [Helicobacter fennelliae]|uniref:Uncharacterized protein n=1 Tax=Helicobacter fennelliae MRY12-0050 TaxID=1325130 RepID=T1CRG6_9HELI|nr:hypothetical protein HFN_0485 [Helicobacter fennelliae MRY12-0050]STP08398.1 Uncharacterised protein [Helicobacter fennelliae]STQ84812.1 Uncharacterised protein [Helicobacter fennelliae]
MIENLALGIIAFGLLFVPAMAIKVALDDKKNDKVKAKN